MVYVDCFQHARSRGQFEAGRGRGKAELALVRELVHLTFLPPLGVAILPAGGRGRRRDGGERGREAGGEAQGVTLPEQNKHNKDKGMAGATNAFLRVNRG